MGHRVDLEGITSGEALFTDCTLVWLLACVRPSMHVQDISLHKFLVAEFTVVTHLVGVTF